MPTQTARDVLVFFGAGASKSVDPEIYPTTSEFMEALRDLIPSSPYHELIVSETRERGAPLNIDTYMATILGMEQDADGNQRTQRRLSQLGLLDQTNGDQVTLARDAFIRDLNTHTDLIRKLIQRTYGRMPSRDRLEQTWLALFDALFPMSDTLEFATTNYDRCLEQALLISKHFGHRAFAGPEDYDSVIDLDRMDEGPRHSKGNLTKINGSVDMVLDGRIVRVGTPYLSDAFAPGAIHYPGQGTAPTESPFKEFHEYFARCVARASCLIVIGCSFGDEYINRILRDHLRDHAKVYIIDSDNSLEQRIAGRCFPRLQPTFYTGAFGPETIERLGKQLHADFRRSIFRLVGGR